MFFLSHKPKALSLMLRSSNCWLLRLVLSQKIAGSIPVSGVVAVLYWFQELGCEPSSCRFDSDRSPCDWKTSGWMRTLSRKQLAQNTLRGSSPWSSARLKQSCGQAAKATGLHPVDRRFDSVRDYFVQVALIRSVRGMSVKRLLLDEQCRFDSYSAH